MKKVLSILIVIILIISPTAFATSGALRKSSIKKCDDGKYYGYHSSEGAIHWHLAEAHSEMSSGWAAVGDPLPGDPCPNKSHENTTTTTTKRVTTTTKAPAAPVVVPNTTGTTRTTTTSVTTTTTVTTSVESTTKRKNNKPIVIKVNNSSVTIRDNKGSYSILNWENDVQFSNEDGYSLKVYDGDVLKSNSFIYEGDKEYKVEVYDNDVLIETDTIKISKYGMIESIIINIIAYGLLLGIPTAIIVVIVVLIKKKKK